MTPESRSAIVAEARAMLAIAAPLAGANLAQMAMQVTTTVMVGHLGGRALAAAGLGAALYTTLLLVCQGVLAAVAPLAAHAIGGGDHRGAGGVAGGGLVLAALLAAPVMLILSLMPGLLTGLGYASGLVAEIGRFLFAVRWGVPAFLGLTVLRFLLIAAFRARVVMLVPLVAVPLNAVLGWVLIFGHFGVPQLGVFGAACTTAIVQWLMLLFFALYLLLARRLIPVSIALVRLRYEIAGIVRLGAPIGVQVALESGLFVTTGILAGLLGANALGAHQLVLNVASLTFQVPLGIAQAATVRVAFRLGRGAPAAARRAAFVALALGALFMAGCALLLATAPRMLAGLYVDLADPANRGLVGIALRLFAIAAIFQVFDGVQVIAAGALRGYRDTAVPMLLAAFGYWAIGFAGGWLLAFPLGYGAAGLWSGMALGLAAVAAGLGLRLAAQARTQVRRMPAPAAGGAAACAVE